MSQSLGLQGGEGKERGVVEGNVKRGLAGSARGKPRSKPVGEQDHWANR